MHSHPHRHRLFIQHNLFELNRRNNVSHWTAICRNYTGYFQVLLVYGLDELGTTGNKCQLCVAAALFASLVITEPEYSLDLFPCYTHFHGVRQQRECASVIDSKSKSCDRGRAVVQTPAN